MTDIVERLQNAADMQERELALDAHQHEMREAADEIISLRIRLAIAEATPRLQQLPAGTELLQETCEQQMMRIIDLHSRLAAAEAALNVLQKAVMPIGAIVKAAGANYIRPYIGLKKTRLDEEDFRAIAKCLRTALLADEGED